MKEKPSLTLADSHAHLNMEEFDKDRPQVIIETDSPYLVPLPYRGSKKRNEPVHVKEVAKTLAEIKNVSLDELARRTSNNFKSPFVFEIKNLRC